MRRLTASALTLVLANCSGGGAPDAGGNGPVACDGVSEILIDGECVVIGGDDDRDGEQPDGGPLSEGDAGASLDAGSIADDGGAGIDAGRPVDPVDAGGPVDPVDAGGPAEPVDAGGPIDPVDAGGPIDPVDAGGPIDPVDGGGVLPSGSLCEPSFVGGNDGCDCGCGVEDPDCAGGGLEACEFAWCNTGEAPSSDPALCEPLVGWLCAPALFGDGLCDCGCGRVDLDCDSNGADACHLCADGCAAGDCALISTDDNGSCT